MINLQNRIQALPDADAQRILTTFASHQPGFSEGRWTPELRQALHNEPELSSTATASAGELARTALCLLADDPNHGAVLEALVSGPRPARYSLLETTALLGAALFVLQTHVKIERDKAGQWTFKLEKKPTDAKLLKDLMGKLRDFGGDSNSVE